MLADTAALGPVPDTLGLGVAASGGVVDRDVPEGGSVDWDDDLDRPDGLR